MALSDYDHLIWDSEGNSVLKGQKFPSGLVVEPYKNWLYLRHAKMWRKGGSFMYPTIGRIDEGTLQVNDVGINMKTVDLVTKENRPFGLTRFFYVECWRSKKPIRLGGIICYGHYDDAVWYARLAGKATVGWDWSLTSSWKSDSKITTAALWGIGPNQQTEEIPLPNYDDSYEKSWHGVSQEMVEAYHKWEVPNKEWLEKVKSKVPERHNPGDAFFARAFKTNTPTSPVGSKKSLPVLAGMLKGLGKQK